MDFEARHCCLAAYNGQNVKEGDKVCKAPCNPSRKRRKSDVLCADKSGLSERFIANWMSVLTAFSSSSWFLFSLLLVVPQNESVAILHLLPDQTKKATRSWSNSSLRLGS